MSQLRGLAERVHHAADDMPLTDTRHSVGDNLDELEDRVRDIAELIVHLANAAAFADREASNLIGAQADAAQHRVTALTHAVGTLGRALADLGAAIAQAGLLHQGAALPQSPDHARTRAAIRSVLDSRLNASRRQLHEAGRQLRLDAEQLASSPITRAPVAAPRPTVRANPSTRTR